MKSEDVMEPSQGAAPGKRRGRPKVVKSLVQGGSVKTEATLESNGASLGVSEGMMADTNGVSLEATSAVIQLGSYWTRYGPSDTKTPNKMRSCVAFRRKDSVLSTTADQLQAKEDVRMDSDENQETSELFHSQMDNVDHDLFQETVDQIVSDTKIQLRRRGGGKPMPWVVKIEELDTRGTSDEKPDGKEELVEDDESAIVLVGNAAAAVKDNKLYDYVEPLESGRIVQCMGSMGVTRAALTALIDEASSSAELVVLVIPEEATRADTKELVDASFTCKSIRNVFLHHTSVSAAFGAGLSSCVVVDIGHTCGYVACVDDGSTIAESRIKLPYGGREFTSSLELLLDSMSEADITTELTDNDRIDVIESMKEQLCDASCDDNDSLAIGNLVTRSQKNLRVSLGVGLRSVAVCGLFYPSLLLASFLTPSEPEMDPDDDDSRWIDSLVDERDRSARAAAARPLGYFSGGSETPVPLDEAVMQSVIKATAGKITDRKSEMRRFLGTILLVGGQTRIMNLGKVLEQRLRRRVDTEFGESDAKNVDVLASEIDVDPSALAWKGGVVLANAESVDEYLVSATEWENKSVRVVREKAPFFW